MLNFKTALKTIKSYNLLVLTILYSQCIFSQSTYSSMTAREKLNYNTEQLKNCENCEIFYFGRAEAKKELGDYRGAIEDYKKANGESTLFSGIICNTLIQIEDYSGAIVEYTKKINSGDFGLADTYSNRAYCKFKLEDFRGAINDYNRAIELDSKFELAYYNRGLAKYNLSQSEGACLDWSKAGELGNEDAYVKIRKHCN
jgi:tetratricopeptide (TPR) repeat protein